MCGGRQGLLVWHANCYVFCTTKKQYIPFKPYPKGFFFCLCETNALEAGLWCLQFIGAVRSQPGGGIARGEAYEK